MIPAQGELRCRRGFLGVACLGWRRRGRRVEERASGGGERSLEDRVRVGVETGVVFFLVETGGSFLEAGGSFLENLLLRSLKRLPWTWVQG